MNIREVFFLPNLLSLSRILIAPAIVYFLSHSETWAGWLACAMLGVAGITDGLDGYLARRSKRITRLGVALDPIADKIFAVVLVFALILYRDFPLWMVALVVIRDLLIAGGGIYLLRRLPDLVLPSNLTGKWAFAALVVLLGAHIIRFDFSINLMTPITAVLLIASLLSYGRVFATVARGDLVKPFEDRVVYRTFRICLAVIVTLAHMVMFWVEYL